MLITILIVLVLFSLVGGAFGGNVLGPSPYGRWSPLGIVLVIVLLLWFTGHLSDGPHVRGRW